MLHHASFNARDTQAVAGVLAEMLVATAVRAPSPPFPQGAWFVCLGDDFGSLIEILPCGTVLDQQAPLDIGLPEHAPALRLACAAQHAQFDRNHPGHCRPHGLA